MFSDITVGFLDSLQGRYTKSGITQYELTLDKHKIVMNDLLGKNLNIEFIGPIQCVGCHAKIKRTFNQGFCYPCFVSLPQNDTCMIKPETCHFSKQTCRDPKWAALNCFSSHTIYLANTSGLKVGITRTNRKTQRWVDQGATQAIPLFEVKDRKTSGHVECFLKKYYADKTNWRKMLLGKQEVFDLESEKIKLLKLMSSDFSEIIETKEPQTDINYPVLNYPNSIKSIRLDPNVPIDGRLDGLKARYLILSNGVVNLNKYRGHKLKISYQRKSS